MNIEEMKNAHRTLATWSYEWKPLFRGYTDKTLYINVGTNEIKEKAVPAEMKEKFIGGKGYGLRHIRGAGGPRRSVPLLSSILSRSERRCWSGTGSHSSCGDRGNQPDGRKRIRDQQLLWSFDNRGSSNGPRTDGSLRANETSDNWGGNSGSRNNRRIQAQVLRAPQKAHLAPLRLEGHDIVRSWRSHLLIPDSGDPIGSP